MKHLIILFNLSILLLACSNQDNELNVLTPKEPIELTPEIINAFSQE